MNKRDFITVGLALLVGFIGGIISKFVPVANGGGRSVYSTRFVLTDVVGREIAVLGADSEKNTALTFLDQKGRERARFGTEHSSFTPFMVMTGSDGRDRVRVRLGRWEDRPVLLLRDERRTRVKLGFHENDVPGPQDEDWGLWVVGPATEPITESDVASLTSQRDLYTKQMFGGFRIRQRDGNVWSSARAANPNIGR